MLIVPLKSSRVLCQKNNSFVFWLTRSHKIPLHTRHTCIDGDMLQFLLSSFSPRSLRASFDMQMRVSSHSPRPPLLLPIPSLPLQRQPATFTSEAQSETPDDWDELYDSSHSVPVWCFNI